VDVTAARSGGARLAVDIGGTFTDVALEHAGRRITRKVLTTPRAPEEGVLEAVALVLGEARVEPAGVGIVVHGTTLATNAIIERKGARTALITTDGFRDVIETAHESRFEQYDVLMDRAPPLVPRELRLTVPERVSAKGEVLWPLDERGLLRLVPVLERERVESVAVGFLHGYRSPAHERRARELLHDALPGLWISLSSEVSPAMREYERFSTAVANAYVRPMMARYLQGLERGLAGRGLACPLLMMTSGGGLTTVATACDFPIRLVESGPAGGAILAGEIAREAGLDHVLSFDMGGTTAKICLIAGREPERSHSFEVARAYRDLKGSGLPLRIPVIEMVEIGDGGGSIARIDAMGRIAVGPASAGSEPGPACYGRGGLAPTVTDADLVLGRLDPERFAGGRIPLEPERAREALERDVGGPGRLDVVWSAIGVCEIVEESMANAARVHAVERGRVIERHTLIAFGGAAPLHAARLARKLGIRRLLVPSGAGVGSAIGFLRAPVAYEVVRSLRVRLGEADPEVLNGLLGSMANEARAVVEAGAMGAPVREQRAVGLRHVGQGHEVQVPLPGSALTREDLDGLRRRFDEAYRAQYGLTIPGLDLEALTWALTATTDPVPAPADGFEPSGRVSGLPPRAVVDPADGGERPYAVHWRPDLAPGTVLAGPALIAEDETSTLVPEGFEARIDGRGHLWLEDRT
jgi:N-methylhydantoinase A